MMTAFQILLLKTEDWQKEECRWESEEAEKQQDKTYWQEVEKAERRQKKECKQEAEEAHEELKTLLLELEERQDEKRKQETAVIKTLIQEQK